MITYTYYAANDANIGRRNRLMRVTDHTNRFGVVRLQLTDYSPTGFGGLVYGQVEEGMKLMVCPPGTPTPGRGGRIVRCRHENGAYRVGVEYDRLAAA